MKAKYIIILFLLTALSFSCKKGLEKFPTDVVGEPEFWKTSADAVQGVTGVYNALTGSGLYGDFIRHSDALTNNAYSQYTFVHYLELAQNQGLRRQA